MTPTPPIQTHWKVRPYMIIQGRARTSQPLLLHTLVSVGRYDPLFAAGLTPAARALYEQAKDRDGCSIAELSAETRMPIGMTRVLLADLAANDRLVIHPDRQPSAEMKLLEQLRDGLAKLA
jgi:hypothetical protein